MKDNKSRNNIYNEAWISLALLFLIFAAGSFISLEGIKAIATVFNSVAWPLTLLVALWWFKPEVSRVVDRLTELNAFGVNAKLQILNTALEQSQQEASNQTSVTEAPTQKQIERAIELQQILGSDSNVTNFKVSSLSEEYHSIRATVSPGLDRTQMMESIVAKMRTIALAAYAQRYELASSPSPGKRLQAIACLQVKPDYDMLDWLIDRIGAEKPFIEYHALVALNIAVSADSAEHHRTALKIALQRAKAFKGRFDLNSDRLRMLESFCRQAEKL